MELIYIYNNLEDDRCQWTNLEISTAFTKSEYFYEYNATNEKAQAVCRNVMTFQLAERKYVIKNMYNVTTAMPYKQKLTKGPNKRN